MGKPTEFHEAFSRALAGVAPQALTLDETDSTNDDARTLAHEGAPHLAVVVANRQRAGRGRLGRSWEAGAGEGLLASWVVRPSLALEQWTLLPLLAGVAAAEAVRARCKVEAVLKWPNDVLVGERKLGGILTEAEVPAFAIVGLGLNVSQRAFPPELGATSLSLEDAIRLDRADLLAATLRRFDELLGDARAGLDRYRALCVTVGRGVRIERAGVAPLEATATAVDEAGALLVDADGRSHRIAAGDVTHVRSVGS